ncbi:MAG: DUF2493 domain-containing protein [Weeksellaceae bacterium]
MNIAIVGSRNFKDYEFMKSVIETYIEEISLEQIIIVSGGAKGADALAEKFASKKGYGTLIFLPEWEKYGRGACSVRNTQIIEKADVVFAFWDGTSRGTKDSTDKAKRMNKKLMVHSY